MEQLRRPQNKIIDIEPAPENEGLDTFEQATLAAE